MTAVPPDAVEVITLWPDGPPSPIANMPPEVAYEVRAGVAAGTTFLRNISEPTLTVFTPEGVANGAGVIVVPGGGWTINAWTHEGVDVARWLTSIGYTAFVLKYRVQGSGADQDAFEARMAAVDATLADGLAAGNLPGRMADLIATEQYLEARSACADDGRRAIEILHEEADRFGMQASSVGMIGFSAAPSSPWTLRSTRVRNRSPSSPRSTAGRPAGHPSLTTHHPSLARSPVTTSWSGSSRDCMTIGHRPAARRNSTCSPEGGTASAWCGRACLPTIEPISS